MENAFQHEVSLNELLVKTSYQTQTTTPDDLLCNNPIAFGAGFIVEYNGKFFVTADHNLHIDDYQEGRQERVRIDNVVSIFNNYTPPDNFLSTVITPLGGFYYMEQFHLDKPDNSPELVDIAICKMKVMHFQYPFLTDEVKFLNETISTGELKWSIKTDAFSDPKLGTNYFVFGKIRTSIENEIRLDRKNTIKEELKYISNVGDYFLFNTIEAISDKKDWVGLSGSPVISENGECVGVLCSVNENSKSIWVMPISKVKMLIEIIAQQEKLEQGQGP
jgi:hypothetical protein